MTTPFNPEPPEKVPFTPTQEAIEAVAQELASPAFDGRRLDPLTNILYGRLLGVGERTIARLRASHDARLAALERADNLWRNYGPLQFVANQWVDDIELLRELDPTLARRMTGLWEDVRKLIDDGPDCPWRKRSEELL